MGTGKNQEVDININIIVKQESPQLKEPGSVPNNQVQKIQVSLSVAQLAYMFRVLTELGIVKNKNLSELMRFLTNNVSTPKAKDISFDSLEVKFYNPDHSTKVSVQDVIIKQLNFIRKDLNQWLLEHSLNSQRLRYEE